MEYWNDALPTVAFLTAEAFFNQRSLGVVDGEGGSAGEEWWMDALPAGVKRRRGMVE